jgi:hypothetical protein
MMPVMAVNNENQHEQALTTSRLNSSPSPTYTSSRTRNDI